MYLPDAKAGLWFKSTFSPYRISICYGGASRGPEETKAIERKIGKTDLCSVHLSYHT